MDTNQDPNQPAAPSPSTPTPSADAEEQQVMQEIAGLEKEEKIEVKQDLAQAAAGDQAEQAATEDPNETPGKPVTADQMQRITKLQQTIASQTQDMATRLGSAGVEQTLIMFEDVTQIISTSGIDDQALLSKYLYACQQAVSAFAVTISSLSPEKKAGIAQGGLLLASEIEKAVKSV